MSKKTKNNSNDGKKGATGKDGAKMRASENEGDGDAAAETMNADEQAMLEKIMSEIEGPQKEKKETDAGTGENSEEPDNNDSTASATEPPRDASDQDLDDDQQKAFESIMAQIQSDDTDDSAAESDGKDAEAPQAEDDFAAELEKVAQKTETPAAEGPSPKQTDDSDDELDDDQQKAFESIMGQIQSDNAAESDGKDAEAPEAEDDFAAELEEVAQKAETPAAEEPSLKQTDDSDDDQQDVLESILSEIEESHSGEKTSQADQKSDPKETEPSSPVQAGPGAGETNEAVDADTDDISDDIEAILNEITSNDDDESNDEGGVAQTQREEPEQAIVADDIVVNEENDSDPVEKDSPSPTAGNETIAPSAEKSKVELAPVSDPDDHTPDAAVTAPQKNAPMRHSGKPGKGRKKKKTGVFIASMLAMLIAIPAAYYCWSLPGTRDSLPPLPVVRKAAPEQAAMVTDPPEPVPVVYHPTEDSRLTGVGQKIDQLRSELISKQKEIEELRDYYQSGIDAEIKSIVDTLHTEGRRPITFEVAMANQRVHLGLTAIQRRTTYIKKLEKPVGTLSLNGEELLYLSRKSDILAIMADKTSDIDIDGFLEEADQTMAAHRSALARLNIDEVDVLPPNLKSIWRQIDTRLSRKKVASLPPSTTSKTENKAIWADICNGNFTRKHKLTALSPEAAGCLATWKGKDLFLNELTTLSPEAASQLADWEGDWLGLNGIKTLSPEAAGHLTRWKGKGLSLNGLSRLSPRVVAILSEWQGDQIELINVKHMAHWENPNTRLFLSETMKRKNNGQGK